MTAPKPSISLIIPALNEVGAIGDVVRAVPPGAADEVLVVDNGSSDATAQAAASSGARVVGEPRRGYGAACLAGALAAQGDVLVFMDGGGTCDPAEIARLLAPLLQGQADLVLGSRVLGGAAPEAMPAHQRLGNALAVRLLRWLYGLRVTDLGPYRAIRRRDLLDLQLNELTYGWPIEMMIAAQRRGLRICEVPVSYRPRTAGISKVSGNLRASITAGWRILGVIARHSLPATGGGKRG